jgi:hypothetical protein
MEDIKAFIIVSILIIALGLFSGRSNNQLIGYLLGMPVDKKKMRQQIIVTLIIAFIILGYAGFVHFTTN